MPYYYVLPIVEDEPKEVVYSDFRYEKPVAYNLLLPSIHSSRDDNVLLTEGDTQEAVTALLNSCRDSASWPSSTFLHGNEGQEDLAVKSEINNQSYQCKKSETCDVRQSNVGDAAKSVKLPAYTKDRSPFWSYDASDPHILDAARSLFFERKRQQAVYEAFPSWYNPTGAPRVPTDYELFVAWASLSRSDKMSYISEVSGSHGVNQLPHNSLESQRAVSALYTSSSDASSWPSLQYSRSMAQPPPPPLPPQTHHLPPRINPQLLNPYIHPI
ncbi:uncharacterized protein LOC124363839 isoform X1 [Homalodisca vitripennis]|uniref:uncharacterized protein LOC124363839 isoform X1 n=1 Tax=Homalodisca vitripennis TaxID=197043 RepID=UPI001EEA8016|nr:uncharacterized protein LOC124363839 isoform X1 [Homalodisca vitripennis]KAG8256700.1 hypothetical protein J6590_063013 [Homalodisca vitripennis]